MYQDTIAAIATPLGEGGIGVIRLSGPEAKAVGERLVGRPLLSRRLLYGRVRDPSNGDTVEEVMVVLMQRPHTYTREDVVEISCHGGPVPLQEVLQLCLREGARLANPGEFTLRAFLNGRIDLAQAEAVLDIVKTKTAAGLRLAIQGLGGRLSGSIRDIRTQGMSVLAYLTARIDFPEDEVEKQEEFDPLFTLQQVQDSLGKLLATADAGIVYRLGVRTAIVGRPNVGKSSLLNRLLGEERAIVTPVPGTTRDTVEETANLGGIPFVLVDTAGLRESKEMVEGLGIERSHRALQQADLALLVVDASEPLTPTDRVILAEVGERTTLLVANKSDLPRKADLASLQWSPVFVSALTGEGISELQQRMVEPVLKGQVVSSDEAVVTNPRHKAALEVAQRHLEGAAQSLTQGLPDDFVTIDLHAALNALGEITGETVTEELLDQIFSRFCIGK